MLKFRMVHDRCPSHNYLHLIRAIYLLESANLYVITLTIRDPVTEVSPRVNLGWWGALEYCDVRIVYGFQAHSSHSGDIFGRWIYNTLTNSWLLRIIHAMRKSFGPTASSIVDIFLGEPFFDILTMNYLSLSSRSDLPFSWLLSNWHYYLVEFINN